MPKEAAESLVVRLRARKGIAREERGKTDIDGLLSSSGAWEGDWEEAFDDYSVKHGRAKSSLWHFPAEFAESLLDANELRFFEHRIAQLVWTNPKIVEAIRRTRQYQENRFEIEETVRKFESRESRKLENPLETIRQHAGGAGKLSRILGNALNIAENIAFHENPNLVVSPLKELCKEIVADRKSKVGFRVSAARGPRSFNNFFAMLRAKREAASSELRVVFYKKR